MSSTPLTHASSASQSPLLVDEVCRMIGERVDWSAPSLRDSEGASRWSAGDAAGACLGLVAVLRRVARPGLGLSPSFIAQLRAGVTAPQRAEAEQRWQGAMRRDLFMPFHRNTFAALGAETIALAATPQRCRDAAMLVLSRRPQWDQYPWTFGATHGICQMIHHFWPLAECDDACFVPMLGWLLAAADVEWVKMRRLTEATLGCSGHNWYAHSFLGFFMAGCWFAEFGFERFRSLGDEYLRRELQVLFHPDGWSKEGAVGYHFFAFSSLLEMADLAEASGIALPSSTQKRLQQIAQTQWMLIAPDGTSPGFGDDGRGGAYSGFVSSLDSPLHEAMTQLRQRAARFGLGQAKFVAEVLDPGWQPPYGAMLPGEGRDWMPAYRALAPQTPPLDTYLPGAGLYVMRQDWTPQADYAAINAGPVGDIVSSHKHLDVFTLELYARGRRLLVDNGYGAECDETGQDKRYRMWRVSSEAHNIATVDGQDLAPIKGEYRYGNLVQPLIDDWRSEAKFAYFSAVHEGYRHLPQEISATRRKLFYLRGRYWIMLDRFTPATAAEHEYALHFQVASEAELLDDGRLVTRGPGGNLLIVPVPGCGGEASLALNPYPIRGYENPRHLCYRRRTAERWMFATLLIPFEGAEVPQVQARLLAVHCDERELPAWESTGLEIAIDGRRDVYVDHHMHWNLPWQCGEFRGNQRLFHSAV